MKRIVLGIGLVIVATGMIGCGSKEQTAPKVDPTTVQTTNDAPLSDRPAVEGSDPR